MGRRNETVPTDHRKRKKLCSSSCNKAKEVLTALSGEECVAVNCDAVLTHVLVKSTW